MPSSSELFDAIEALRDARQAHEASLREFSRCKEELDRWQNLVDDNERDYVVASENVKRIIEELADQPLPLKWD